MNRTGALLIGFWGVLAAGPVAAAESPAPNCPAGNVILAAKVPDVDLYKTNGKGGEPEFAKSVPREQFGSCVPIKSQSKASLLEVMVDGQDYWVPPNMVDFQYSNGAQPKKICATWSDNGSEEKKVGSTRALGNGCPGAEKQKK
jgi:hypothetical protein